MTATQCRATHSRQASSHDDESPCMCLINQAVRVNKTSIEALEGGQPAGGMTSEVKSYASLSGWWILSERAEIRNSFFLLSKLWYGENCLLLLLLLNGCPAIPMMSRDLVISSCQSAKGGLPPQGGSRLLSLWSKTKASSDRSGKVNYTAQQVMSGSCGLRCCCGDVNEEITWSDRGCVVPFLAPRPGLCLSKADIWGVIDEFRIRVCSWREGGRKCSFNPKPFPLQSKQITPFPVSRMQQKA